MKKVLAIAGVATLVAVLAVAAVGVVALAQDDDDGSVFFNFRARMTEAVAGILGVEVDVYEQALDQAQDQVLEQAVQEGALTQDQADRMQERQEEGFGPGLMGPRGFGRGGFRFDHGRGGMFGNPGEILGTAAEQLGMSVEDLSAELKAGKSIADLAAEKNVEPQAIVDAYVASVTEMLDEAVASERITQEQADKVLEEAESTAQRLLEGNWMDKSFGRGGYGMRFGGSHLELAAEKLGMPVEDLVAELEAGKTIAELAEAQGVAVEEIVKAYVDDMAASLATAVESGRLTQDQADKLLEGAAEMFQQMLEEGMPFHDMPFHGPGGYPGSGQPGRFRTLPSQDA